MRKIAMPVLGRHPVLSRHYRIPPGCPLNTGFTVIKSFNHLVSPWAVEAVSQSISRKSFSWLVGRQTLESVIQSLDEP